MLGRRCRLCGGVWGRGGKGSDGLVGWTTGFVDEREKWRVVLLLLGFGKAWGSVSVSGGICLDNRGCAVELCRVAC
jgi:hypothetical protein